MEKRIQIRFITFIILTVFFILSSFSQVKNDVIYLKSGGKAIGHIVKKVEGEPVLLKIQSDETITIEWNDIKEIGEFISDTVAHPLNLKLPEEKSMTPANNTIFLEGGGNALTYSINYDRLISDNVSLRVGYSSISVSIGLENVGLTIIPVMANYLYGKGNSKLELGGGLMVISFSGNFIGDYKFSGSGVGFTSTIGYRYQPNDGGFNFRICVDPFIGTQLYLWGGMSLGVTF